MNRFFDLIRGETRRDVLLHYLLILACGFLAYANTFGMSFNFDDVNNLIGNQAIRNMQGFVDPFNNMGHRPVGVFSFALNYAVHGLNVFGYHLVNILIHLTNALLVYALVMLTGRSPVFADGAGEEQTGRFRGVALFTALFFVSHPLQTQAVTYIIQRFTSLATCFFLAALILYILARQSQFARSPWNGRALLLFSLSMLATAAAMLTKEIAFTLPLIIVVYEFMFFRGSLAKRALALLAMLCVMGMLPLFLVLRGFDFGRLAGALDSATRVQTAMPRLDYLFTQFRVIVTYLRLIFLPVNQNLDYDYPLYHSFWNPAVLGSFLLLLAIFGLGVYLVRRSAVGGRQSAAENQSAVGGRQSAAENQSADGGRRSAAENQSAVGDEGLTIDHRPSTIDRLSAFGIFWFFITLAVESSVLPIVDVIFEHRMYLPSVGAFLAIVSLVLLTAERLAAGQARVRALVTGALALLVVVLMGATFQRNRVWATDATLWEDTVAKSPDKSRPWNNLGCVYLKQKETLKAVRAFTRSIAISPGHPDVWNNVGLAIGQSRRYDGRFSPTYEMFDGSAQINQLYQSEWFALAYNNLGLAYDLLGQNSEALAKFRSAIEMNPRLGVAHYNLGLALLADNQKELALLECETLNGLDPGLAAQLLKAVGGRQSAVGN